VENPLGELLDSQINDRKFSRNFMIKLDIVDIKQPTINSQDGISGKGCTTMLSNMSNHAKNASAGLGHDRKNLYTPHGA
jgi:hypothetical protein